MRVSGAGMMRLIRSLWWFVIFANRWWNVSLIQLMVLCFDGSIGSNNDISSQLTTLLIRRSRYSLWYWLWVCTNDHEILFPKVPCSNSNATFVSLRIPTLDAKTWDEANDHLEDLYSTQAPLEVRAIFCKTWFFSAHRNNNSLWYVCRTSLPGEIWELSMKFYGMGELFSIQHFEY